MPLVERKVVVLAVDTSEASFKVVDYAAKEIPQGYEVRLLHIHPVIPHHLGGYVGDEPAALEQKDLEEIEAERAQKFLTLQLLPRVQLTHPDAIPVLVKVGSTDASVIGAALCKYAQDNHANPVIIAAHNRPTLEELFVGSVTEYCVHHCYEVHLLHVLPSDFFEELVTPTEIELEELEKAEVRVALDEASQIGGAICKYSSITGASLVIMGNRGKSTILEFSKSLVDHCVKHCRKPLMLLWLG
ncbi:hypothetical protein WJX72_009363 [[Myrmecia] bisecta]|uniref:UspA domain-containing protein n=1 Tax=[Myrmecia] bisecta TaxID=41462 RepID=A0AAW1Q808_9CHLO